MVSFEFFVKSMPPSLSELKVLPSFCFAFKIPDDVAVTTNYVYIFIKVLFSSQFADYQSFLGFNSLVCSPQGS